MPGVQSQIFQAEQREGPLAHALQVEALRVQQVWQKLHAARKSRSPHLKCNLQEATTKKTFQNYLAEIIKVRSAAYRQSFSSSSSIKKVERF